MPPSPPAMSRRPDAAPSPPLSLHQIVAQHPRERLHVPPLEWTARHLALLRCSFAEPTSSSSLPTQASDDVPPMLRRKRAKTAKAWAEGCGVLRSLSTRDLLSTADYGQLCIFPTGSYFRHHQRRVARTQSYTFAFPTPDTTPLPVAAWTEPSLINGLRRDTVGSARQGRRRNSPVRRIAEAKCAALVPPDRWKDPYLLALLIAVAQWQRSILLDAGLWDRPLFQPYVLYTDRDDKEHVHVYSASLPPAFLDRFDDPAFAPPSLDPVTITHTTVPFRPYGLLYNRLLGILTPAWYTDPLRRRQERIERVVQAMRGDLTTEPGGVLTGSYRKTWLGSQR